MRIHFEISGPAATEPVPGGDGSASEEVARGAHRLAAGLAARGYRVTARGGGVHGVADGVRYLLYGSPGADVLVSAGAEPASDIAADVRVAWAWRLGWPRDAESWDLVVAGSDWHAARLRERMPGARVDVLGTPAERAPPRSATPDRFVYTGDPTRGLHRLLDLWPALWDAFRTPLAVDGDLRALLRLRAHRADAGGARLRQIASRVDQPGILLPGALPRARRAELLARAQAALAPLEPVGEALDAPPLRTCLAAGARVVASSTAELRFDLGADATYVEGFDASTWIDAVRRTLDAPARPPDQDDDGDAAWLGRWEALLGAAPRARAGPARQRWLAVVVGFGSGEAALTREVVDEARRRGHAVDVVVNERRLTDVTGEATVSADVPREVTRLADAYDRILLASSLTCLDVLRALRAAHARAPVIGLDYGWPEWLAGDAPDLLVSTLTPEALASGLDGARPSFRLHDDVARRIRCVGPLASPAGDGLDDPIDILVYLGFEHDWARRIAKPLSHVLRELEVTRGVRACLVGPDGLGPEIPTVRELSPERFRRAVAGARLVVTHSGAATIGLARAYGTPVLCLTPGRALSVEPHCLGEREAQAWFEAGWVEHLVGDLPASRYRETLEAMLDEPRPAAEPGGAARAVALIEAAARAPARSLAWSPPELRP